MPERKEKSKVSNERKKERNLKEKGSVNNSLKLLTQTERKVFRKPKKLLAFFQCAMSIFLLMGNQFEVKKARKRGEKAKRITGDNKEGSVRQQCLPFPHPFQLRGRRLTGYFQQDHDSVWKVLHWEVIISYPPRTNGCS